jgi:hypothetical protein
MTTIDKKLNLVVPVAGGWVHAVPISYAIFEKYFLPISKAFAQVYSEGLGTLAGPRVAHLLLKKIAIEDQVWEGIEGVENGLMNEIIRLSNFISPGDHGWGTLPLYEAIRQQKLDEEEVSEVLNALVFFTLTSLMHKKDERARTFAGVMHFWRAQTTLLDSTAFLASLPTSTPDAPTGEKATPLSIPS